MENYELLFILENIAEPDDQIEDALFRAGCDDALLYSINGVTYLNFDRKSVSYKAAITSAIQQIENAGFNILYE